MTQVTVPVTAGHIARGKPGDCAACPITLAVLDAIPQATHAEVWWAYGDEEAAIDEMGAGVTIWLARGTLTHRLGAEADAFIRAFDEDGTAGPVTLTLTIPEEAL